VAGESARSARCSTYSKRSEPLTAKENGDEVQNGNKATGNLLVTSTRVERSGSVTILLSGNDVYLVYPTGFTGYLTVSGDEMKGQIDGLNPANVVLKRQK
jgi:hypothetical protein